MKRHFCSRCLMPLARVSVEFDSDGCCSDYVTWTHSCSLCRKKETRLVSYQYGYGGDALAVCQICGRRYE